MIQPWDVPPFPPHGDEDRDSTFKMVGYALTEWEELEYYLSHLYAQLIGRHPQIPALREYGNTGRIFADRVTGLEKVAETFFVAQPHQSAEAEFSRIVTTAKKLADRRNEIAHGVVRPLQWTQSLMQDYAALREQRELEYALIPPLYTRQKLDEKHRPKYIYTANELMQFALAFSDLSREVVELRLLIARIQRS